MISNLGKLSDSTKKKTKKKKPKPQTNSPLYQLQVEEGITHGRKPELVAYRGLNKLQIMTSYNKQKL